MRSGLNVCRKSPNAQITTTAIVVAIALIFIPALGQATPYRLEKKDNIISKIFHEVQSFIFRFASLPQEEIVKIFHNWFKPINFYHLHHMRGHYYKLPNNQK